MNSKFGTIKNPLTIIAIFAGIAEVSGTAILPFLQFQNQTLYVWFLMIFPFTIVLLFFITLNWNYKVLYAPSDFQNEDHFIDILGKASVKEVLTKAGIEAEEFVTAAQEDERAIAGEDLIITNDIQISPAEVNIQMNETHNVPSVNDLLEKLGLLSDEVSNKEIRETRSRVLQALQRKLMKENNLAQDLALDKLAHELSVPIRTEIKIDLGSSTYVFDGVIRQNNKLTVVETRFIRDASKLSAVGILRNHKAEWEKVYMSLSEEQRNDFSLIFVLVTDVVDDKVLSRIELELKNLPFLAKLKCYEFDKLWDD